MVGRRQIAGGCSVVLLTSMGMGCNRQGQACYLGPDESNDQCFELTNASDIRDPDYDYPEPYQGSAQYSAPLRYLDLEAVDLALSVAPNFQLFELADPANGAFAVVQPHAVERLQELRDAVGAIDVTSGYRSPGYNATIPGSATSSRHQYGDAFDLSPQNGDLDALDAACTAAGASYIGVYETHRHCDWRFTTLDSSFYGAELTGSRGRTPLDISSVRALPLTDATVVPIEIDGSTVLTAPATGWDEGEPLREWTAYNARGHLIEAATGRTYTPPADAVEVDVEVGREVIRTFAL
ncbi:MAG: D-Ala-D-Ala carboxypeptidase family metallohydrolase [Myxococcota bacterium]